MKTRFSFGMAALLSLGLLLAWPSKSQSTVSNYFYVVSAVDANGLESSNSNEYAQSVSAIVSASGHSVVLTWTASSTPGVSYKVKRASTAGGPYTAIGSATGLTFSDVFVPPNPPGALLGATK